MNMSTRLDGDTHSVHDLGLSDVVADLATIFEHQDTMVDGINYVFEPDSDPTTGTGLLVVDDRAETERWFKVTVVEVPVAEKGAAQ
jgi:hypothetical protein